MDSGSKIISVSFSVWSDKFEAAYDLFIAEMEAKVRMLQSLGVPNDQIIEMLDNDIMNEQDIFGGLMGKGEKYIDDLANAIAQSASNDFDMNEKLDWILDPTAEHCDTCLRNSEMDSKTFAEWEMIGIPGAGNTECGVYCKCSLEPAGNRSKQENLPLPVGGKGTGPGNITEPENIPAGQTENIPGWKTGQADRYLAESFIEARNRMPQDKQGYLTHSNAEELASNGSKIFLSEDGQNGFIISRDGDLQNVFSMNHMGKESLRLAIENGATTLDCFDGFLPDYYKKFGFEEIRREANWTAGEPDVVYMRLKGK